MKLLAKVPFGYLGIPLFSFFKILILILICGKKIFFFQGYAGRFGGYLSTGWCSPSM
jgi:hypothetical protein